MLAVGSRLAYHVEKVSVSYDTESLSIFQGVPMSVQARTSRRDVVRNRARIVETAREAFDTLGMDVPLDTVAKLAGVGAGTLYRHFPSREDLVAAVLEDRRPDLEQERLRLLQVSDPVEALEGWLDALARWMRAYDGLPEPIRAALSDGGSPLMATCKQLIDTTERFLDAAQRSGHARADIRGRDLYVGALGAAWAAGMPSTDGTTRESAPQLLRQGWQR